MARRDAGSDIGAPLVRQAWRVLTFLHWPYEREVVQRCLPEGLVVDDYDGTAWVSITLLRMTDVRLQGLPAVRGLSTFPETNLRTYVRDLRDRPGVWFFSLDAASAWITAGARLFLGLPYVRSRLAIEADDGVHYSGRRPDESAAYDIRVHPAEPVVADERDSWLTDRWRAFTRHRGRLLEVPVRHGPWPLRAATVATMEQSLLTAAGLPEPSRPPIVHFSDGVADVAFGVVRPVPGH